MSRTTLSDLRETLRGMTEAGTAEYTLGTSNYWDDDQLDKVLDRHRTDYINMPLVAYPVVGSGGTSLFYEYRSNVANFETTSGGTAIFWIQDGTYATIGTSLYSVDYQRGIVTFSADTGGSAYFYNGRSFDLNSAAADIWRKKASHYYSSFSFSTDNHSVQKEQIYKHCQEMADMYESMGQLSVSTLQVWRSDTDFTEVEDD